MSGSWARGAILAAAPRQGDKDAQDPRPQRWAGRIQGDSTRHRGQADDRRKWGSGHSNHGGGYVDASDVVAKNNAAAESVLGFTPRRYPWSRPNQSSQPPWPCPWPRPCQPFQRPQPGPSTQACT